MDLSLMVHVLSGPGDIFNVDVLLGTIHEVLVEVVASSVVEAWGIFLTMYSLEPSMNFLLKWQHLPSLKLVATVLPVTRLICR